jgi:O-antigen ligase
MTPRHWQRLSQVAFIGLAVFLSLAWLAGGSADGWVGERWLALPALALIVVAVWRVALMPEGTEPGALRAWWLVPSVLLALPLLQLLPLPPWLWSMLPGREALGAELQLAGVAPGWRPLSVNAPGTEQLLLSLLAPIAVFMGGGLLHGEQRRALVWGLLAFAAFCALLGLLQQLDGPQSEMYLYEISNRGSAVGMFANRNHLASLLAVSLPVAMGVLSDRLRHQSVSQAARDLRVWLLTALLVLLCVSITATQSRAGFLLLMVAVLAAAMVLWRGALWQRTEPRARSSQHWLRLAAVLAGALIVQYTLYALLLRIQAQDAFEDGRWQYVGNALQASAPTRGLGWGLGSFVETYDEAGEVVADAESYINHAHNDFLELWIEGGVFAVVACVLALWFLARLTRRAWHAQRHSAAQPLGGQHHHHGLGLGAACGLWLLVVHSTVDYPLRTTTLACTAALLLAVLNGSVRHARAGATRGGLLFRSEG